MLVGLALAVAAACSPRPQSGPAPLHWDRDTCERCGMVISDRRYAVEVRTAGDGRLHRFDDLGCALLWLDEHRDRAGKAAEIWVRDPTGRSWRSGLGARYSDGHRTPMGYGFAVAAAYEAEGLDLAAVRKRIRELERERRGTGR